MTPKAYSYVRFSTPEQLKGDSLRRQLELSERYVAEHGLVIDTSLNLRDMGFSAYHGHHKTRGALGTFLELVKAGKIPEGSVLLVESLDRLSREEITEALEQFLAIIGSGIKIVTLADNNREYTKETINANIGELIVGLTIMSRAHEESRMKALRLSKAWEAKREKAGNGKKKMTAKAPAWLRLTHDRKDYEVITERAEIIQRIFRERLAGKGREKIARELNLDSSISWKPKSPRKRNEGLEGWWPSYVDKILRSRAVLGEYQPHKMVNGKRCPVGEPWKDYFPAVITEDVFYQVQELFRESQVESKNGGNVGRGGRNGKVSNLFVYIVRCGYCGAPMQHVDKGEWKYLVCSSAVRRSGCEYLSVTYKEVEETILKYCRGLDPAELLPGREEVESVIRLLQGQLSTTRSKLETANRRAFNLSDEIADTEDKATRAMLKTKLEAILKEKNDLEKQKTSLERELEAASRVTQDVRERIESLNKLFDTMGSLQGQELIDLRLRLRQELRRLITRIDIYPEGKPRITPKLVDDYLRYVREGGSENEQSGAFLKTLKMMQEMVANAKEYLYLEVVFAGGSVQHIYPRDPSRFLEIQMEPGVLRFLDENGDPKRFNTAKFDEKIMDLFRE